jgi:glycerol-3-phosphate dehydrogenase
MVVHLEDLLRRRLALLILSKMTPLELQRFAEIAAKVLACDDDIINRELKLCMKLACV